MEQLKNMAKDYLKEIAKQAAKALLKNPYTYMVLGVMFIIIIIIGTMADVNDVSASNGGSMTNNISNNITGDNIQEKVWNTLRLLGYSEVSTAAAMGNIHYESGGFKPDKVESNGTDVEHLGIGICQWTNNTKDGKVTEEGRNTNLRKFAESRGKDWKDEDIQVEFLMAELNGGGAGGFANNELQDKTVSGVTYKVSEWKNATDSETLDVGLLNKLTEIFCYTFERPKADAAKNSMAERQKYAKEYYDKYKGTEITFAGESKEVKINSAMGIIAKFTSGITGKTFYIFNQMHDDINFKKDCNNAVAASIASGYDSEAIKSEYLTSYENWKHIIEKAREYITGNVLSNADNTKKYFDNYGLKATIKKSGSYSIDNIRKKLTTGQYIAIRFKDGSASLGKSGEKYSESDGHWIGIIGYRKMGNKEEIYIVDTGYYHKTGWKDIDEFETCKGNIQWFTTIK